MNRPSFPVMTAAYAVEPVVDDELADEGLLVEEDLLVEDVSIDGMCGVY